MYTRNTKTPSVQDSALALASLPPRLLRFCWRENEGESEGERELL